MIEGARYDLGAYVEALRDVVADLKTGRIANAVELLEHEVASTDALLLALSSGDES